MTRRILALMFTGAAASHAAKRKRKPKSKKPAAEKPSAKREKLLESLRQADADFAEATRVGRLDGWMSFFADDATAFPAGKPLIAGKEELRSFYSKMFEDPSLEISWKPVKADVAESGDLGYTIGTAEFRTKAKDGSPVIRPGKYLTVWKKQKDGAWKVAADLGN
jgi:ketosteroid isomerase-like protein